MAALGLTGWAPSGMIRWSMELINVSTGMPWFWTLIVGSAMWRLFCVPFAIRGFQVSARMMPLQPKIKEYQDAVTRSKLSQNPLELQRAVQGMKRFYAAHNINPLAGLVSMIQLPITFGLFFGVKKLCNLPLEQLTYSGVSFIPDLTVSDPTMILPLAMFVLVNIQIKVSLPDFNLFLLNFYSCFITAFDQGFQYYTAT
jgi:YidC/Oxa1 family membrane protein insertase